MKPVKDGMINSYHVKYKLKFINNIVNVFICVTVYLCKFINLLLTHFSLVRNVMAGVLSNYLHQKRIELAYP